jgi:hypothetical protein
MGLGCGTFWKKLIVVFDRRMSAASRSSKPDYLDRGRYWWAHGDNDHHNLVLQKCVALIEDFEISVRSLAGDAEVTTLKDLSKRAIRHFIEPFLSADRALNKLVVLTFDNSRHKPLNKAETSLGRMDRTEDILVPDSEIPCVLLESMSLPAFGRVLATPKYKMILYNYLLGEIHAYAQGLEVEDECGLIVACPYMKEEEFPIADFDRYMDGARGGPFFYLTGEHYIFSKASFDLPHLPAYGEGDIIVRLYSDWIQDTKPGLMSKDGAYILVRSKDSDSLPIFLMQDPGKVILNMGTVKVRWMENMLFEHTYTRGESADEREARAAESKAEKERLDKELAFFVYVGAFYKGMNLSSPRRAMAFALACILSGTDYVKKPAGVSSEAIFSHICRPKSVRDSKDMMAQPFVIDEKYFRVHQKKAIFDVKYFRSALPGAWKTCLAKAETFVENCDNYILRVIWNLKYWALDDSATGGPNALLYGWRPARADEPHGYWSIPDGEGVGEPKIPKSGRPPLPKGPAPLQQKAGASSASGGTVRKLLPSSGKGPMSSSPSITSYIAGTARPPKGGIKGKSSAIDEDADEAGPAHPPLKSFRAGEKSAKSFTARPATVPSMAQRNPLIRTPAASYMFSQSELVNDDFEP